MEWIVQGMDMGRKEGIEEGRRGGEREGKEVREKEKNGRKEFLMIHMEPSIELHCAVLDC